MHGGEHVGSSSSPEPSTPATGEIVGRPGLDRSSSGNARTTARGTARANARGNRRTRPSRTSRGRAIAGWATVLFVAAIVAAPIVLGATARAASPSPSSSQSNGSDVSAGAALFQQSCATCHGTQAEGAYNADGSQRAPDIRNAGAAAVDFVLRTGRMPLSDPSQPMTRGPVKFNAQQIAQLTAFVSSLGKGPAIPQVDTTGADLSRGRALFNANCAACHAPSGAGNAIGEGFNAPGLMAAAPVEVGEAMRIGPPPMPVFGPNSFSQQDVNDIAAYIQYLQTGNPSPGGLGIGEIGPVPEGFVAFVFGLSAVLLIARFVGRRGNTAHQTTLSPSADRGDEGTEGEVVP